MTPAAKAFKRARHLLGLDPKGMAKALRLADAGSARRYERGTRAIGGPVSLCVDLLPPLAVLLREWEGWSEIEVLEASCLSEMAADAVLELREVLLGAGLPADYLAKNG